MYVVMMAVKLRNQCKRNRSLKYLGLQTPVLLLLCVVQWCSAYIVDNNPYRHFETLDSNGRYTLEWLVDLEEERVIFNVTAQTRGYVGFGLSLKGKMSGADIVIGGISNDGQPYFSDRYAIGNQVPREDESQDWNLLGAWESDTHTFLSFSRAFDTCDDDHDLKIDDNVLSLIWAFGENDDELEFHYQNRGTFDVYLLDPDLTPRIVETGKRSRDSRTLGEMKVWTIPGTYRIPPKDTTYICTIHKAPRYDKKVHIVGFNSILETELSRRHIHHFLLHRCYPPEGQDAASVFQRFVGGRGEECYVLSQPAGRIPTHLCTEVKHVWAVGQRPNFFPGHVGLPLSESRNEFYMLQMHFDNPELLSGLDVRYSLEIFYTENVREHDGGMLALGELTPASPSIMVPPSSPAHLIYGHCGTGCTQKILPKEGIRVFATNLHTHLAGRGVRLLHIRNDTELPLLSYDDNYNFNFQQIRVLREEVVVLPGDLLINRCVYSNTDRNGSVTVGGFSSRNEMCSGFIWYYNKIPNVGVCRSEIRSDVYRSFVDIWNTTWSNTAVEMIVTSPSQFAGLRVSDVGTNYTEWSIDRRIHIQRLHRYLPQVTQCPPVIRRADEEPIRSTTTPSALKRYFESARRDKEEIIQKKARTVINDIRDPKIEFISVYGKDVIPYREERHCDTKKKRK